MKGRFTVGNGAPSCAARQLIGHARPGQGDLARNAAGSEADRQVGRASRSTAVQGQSKTDTFHLSGPGVNTMRPVVVGSASGAVACGVQPSSTGRGAAPALTLKRQPLVRADAAHGLDQARVLAARRPMSACRSSSAFSSAPKSSATAEYSSQSSRMIAPASEPYVRSYELEKLV